MFEIRKQIFILKSGIKNVKNSLMETLHYDLFKHYLLNYWEDFVHENLF